MIAEVNEMPKTLKIIYIVSGVLCILYYMLMGVCKRFGLSMSWLWAALGVVLVAVGFSDKVTLPGWLRIVWRAGLCACIVYVLVLCGVVMTGMKAVPPQNVDYLIVLGARVEANGVPSPALQHRIDAAAEYLSENPDTLVIATGGQGSDEDMTEADCIKVELMKLGIPEERILMEDESTSTTENLKNSLAIIGDKEKTVGIVTNNYHVYRSVKLAEKVGYTSPYGFAASYTGITLPNYLVREAVCLTVEWLTGEL